MSFCIIREGQFVINEEIICTIKEEQFVINEEITEEVDESLGMINSYTMNLCNLISECSSYDQEDFEFEEDTEEEYDSEGPEDEYDSEDKYDSEDEYLEDEYDLEEEKGKGNYVSKDCDFEQKKNSLNDTNNKENIIQNSRDEYFEIVGNKKINNEIRYDSVLKELKCGYKLKWRVTGENEICEGLFFKNQEDCEEWASFLSECYPEFEHFYVFDFSYDSYFDYSCGPYFNKRE